MTLRSILLRIYHRFKGMGGVEIARAENSSPLWCLEKRDGAPKCVYYYLADALRDVTDECVPSHSNVRMARFFAAELQSRGYEVWVGDYRHGALPEFLPKLVFGQGPAYFRCLASLRNEKFVSVYLGAGVHPRAAADVERRVLRQFQRKYGVSCKPALSSSAPDVVGDGVVAIGNQDAARNYQGLGNRRVCLIPNVALPGLMNADLRRDYGSAKRNFVWMAGYAPVVRGLHHLFEAFRNAPELTLWVCGAIQYDREFQLACDNGLEPKNVKRLGWVDVNSATFLQVASECAFMIYPSATDSIPGSVLNAMAVGLIPVVSRSSHIDVGSSGYVMESPDSSLILSTIRQLSSMTSDQLTDASLKTRQYVRENYSETQFAISVRHAFDQLIPVAGS